MTEESNVKLKETRANMEKSVKLTVEEREKVQEEIKDIVMDEKYHLLGKYKDLYLQLQDKDELYMSTASSKPIWIDHINKVTNISEEFLKENLTATLKRVFTVPILHIIPNKMAQVFTYDLSTKNKKAYRLEGIIKSNHFDSVLIKNLLYIIGGMSEESKALLPTTFEYEFQEKEVVLHKKANMIKARFGHKALTVSDSFIYALGGVTTSFLGTKYANNCEKYDKLFNRWIEIKPMNECKGYMTVCSFKERFIYVFGGFRDDL